MTRSVGTVLELSVDIICKLIIDLTENAVEAATDIAVSIPTKENWEVVVALKAALDDLQAAYSWALRDLAKNPRREIEP